MEIVVVADEGEFAAVAADQVCTLLRHKPAAVLGLPTGNTPVGLYAELVKRNRAGEVDFRRCTTFNLDEYVGLPADHAGSYRTFMWKNLFSGINLPATAAHLPAGDSGDPVRAAREYEALLAKLGPIDLMVLGIGTNGHIGFNEPYTAADSRAHVSQLTPSTIRSNSVYFGREELVPRQAITLGLGNILESRRIMLLAKGESKAKAIAATVMGEIAPTVPASYLQRHPAVMLILDGAAAALLHKPGEKPGRGGEAAG